MKRIFSILFAVVLVVSFSLIPATPAMADNPAYIPYESITYIDPVRPGDIVPVSMNVITDHTVDVHVEFKGEFSWGHWTFVEEIITVTANETITAHLDIPGKIINEIYDLEKEADRYYYMIWITPAGGDWDEREYHHDLPDVEPYKLSIINPYPYEQIEVPTEVIADQSAGITMDVDWQDTHRDIDVHIQLKGEFSWGDWVYSEDTQTVAGDTTTQIAISLDVPLNILLDEPIRTYFYIWAAAVGEPWSDSAWAKSYDVAVNLGLVALWHLDEGSEITAYDSTVHGNDGTITGASWATSANAMFGDALSFDGVDDYVELPATNTIVNSNTFTVEAWFKTSLNHPAYGGTEGRIVNLHWKDTASTAVSLYVEEAKIGLLYHKGSMHHVWVTHDVNYYNNVWHHIAVTYDATTYRLYYDGAEVASRADPFGGFGTFPAYLGTYNSSERFFNGIIDEVRIWDVVLSSQEILESFWLGEAGNNDDYDTIVSHEAGSSVFIFTSAFHDVDTTDTIRFRLMRVGSTETIDGTAGTNGISIRRVTPKGSTWTLDGVADGDTSATERDIDPGTPNGPRSHQTLHLDANLTGELEPLGFNLHTQGL